ncbi:MAG: TatD family hydrolase [Alphaproteobacteria bacterium]|nr:TatD family hydrolase [Alphaproteobacteria bacterium]
MQKYIDAHCHIGNGVTDGSVAAFFCNSVSESDWSDILSTSKHNPAVLPCLGVHPWYINDIVAGWDARLYNALVKNPRAMVGEIGLDKLRPHYDIQMDVFMRQMQIANDLQRVVHIHCVRAWNDILTCTKFKVPAIVLHGFTGMRDVMLQLGRRDNIYFSFGCAVCDARRARLMSAVCDVPLSRILIESDGDMCNSGAVLRDVINRIAEIKHISPDDLSGNIYNNSIQVAQNG